MCTVTLRKKKNIAKKKEHKHNHSLIGRQQVDTHRGLAHAATNFHVFTFFSLHD